VNRLLAPGRWRRRWTALATCALLSALTVWSAGGVGFSASELLGNLARAARILDDSWPPDWKFWPRLWGPFLETLQIAVLGSAVGALLALPLALLAARAVAPRASIRWASRSAMNLLRTLPDLFWAMLFASAVGFGPLAGALALCVFTTGVVSKLLSESTESIDLRLLEAVRGCGGSWFATVRFSVLPQILPQYIAYALYAFELNVRASTVLGLVGAGGLGMLLDTQRTLFEYGRITLIVGFIYLVVLAIEALSETLRRRLT